MKKVFLLCFLAVCILGCISCSASRQPESTAPSLAYEIKTVVDQTATNGGQIHYPKLESNSMNVDEINQTIKDALFSYLEKTVAEFRQTAIVELNYTTPTRSNELLCILFKGNTNDPSAAHPTNIAFTVCVSVPDGTLVSPTALFQLDDAFLASFRNQLAQNPHPERYDAAQWEQIAAYIGDRENEDIAKLLHNDPQGTLVIAENGVVVLFPVPHAAGDYIEILVP